MSNLLRLELWLKSLVAAFIGGAASALTADQGLSLAHKSGVDVPILNWKAIGIVALSSGIFSVALYLKGSPLPKLEIEETKVITETTETKTTETKS